MKESEFLDLMNGLDARYADETVSRLHQEAVTADEAEFTAVAPVRRPRRLFAGIMTAAAAAACVVTVTVLLPKLRNNPEVVKTPSVQSAADLTDPQQTDCTETGRTPYTEEDAQNGSEIPKTAVRVTDSLETTAERKTEVQDPESVTSVSESPAQTLVSATTATFASSASSGSGTTGTTADQTPMPVMKQYSYDGTVWYSLWLPTNYCGTVTVTNDAHGTQKLNDEQAGYILSLMSGAKLVPYEERLIPRGGQNSSYLTAHCSVELNGTGIRWDVYRNSVSQTGMVWIDGVCYYDQNACGSNSIILKYYNAEQDAAEQIIQYTETLLNSDPDYFVMHLPDGYTGRALVYTITCAQNPIQLTQGETNFILTKMNEAKLTECPARDLPTGGPITVELEGTGIRWDIYTDTVVVIDGKYYEDSTLAVQDIEMYALGFLRERPE